MKIHTAWACILVSMLYLMASFMDWEAGREDAQRFCQQVKAGKWKDYRNECAK